ncbi:MAG: glycosyltransferase [Candidatus Paceibacterota bacterium]
MKPLISIILPTYNGEKYIAAAIESVFGQTYISWELLIISDGSIDNTRSIVEKYAKNENRIIFIENEKNIGIQKTLNKGLSLAKGDYIARLDDDDRWIDIDKLSLQVIYFLEHEGYVLVGTNALVVNTEGKEVSKNTMPQTDRDIRSRLLSKNCFLHPTVMINKAALERAGLYSEKKEFLHAEDYELWLRLGKQGKMGNIIQYTTALTAHSDSLTSSNRSSQARNFLKIAWRYRQYYPNSFIGIAISVLRYVGFVAISFVPIPQSMVYKIQRIYRSI